MENIYAITISDFQEKIHFLNKVPTFDFDHTVKIMKSLNKSLTSNYLQEHISKNVELKLMDTMINQKLKIKISILGEIIIEMLYNSNIDLNYINIINQRMIEALSILTKTKKIKMEYLIKRYPDVCVVLDDTIFQMDPRIRLTSKNAVINIRDVISVKKIFNI
jgi:hypothetical protein